MPVRIQRSRAKGWRKPEGAVDVSRGSRWGNPFTVAEHGRTEAVRLFCEALESPLFCGRAILKFDINEVQHHLRGKTLMCWCRVGQACHADVLLEAANRPDPEAAI
jgi:hypothetical protein